MRQNDPHRVTRGEGLALLALGLLLGVTAGWWALALWPVPADTPAWLLRTREVCFGRTESGLPEIDGWMLLVGQPLGMLGLLLAGWRRPLGRGLTKLAGSAGGRALLVTTSVWIVLGLTGAGFRVATASAEPAWASTPTDELPADSYPTIDRPAPDHVLVDQEGRPTAMEAFRGRPVLVTFAFGHCETICPVVVQRIVAAREALVESGGIEASEAPALVVVTLDPWRDTPARLAPMHETWGLPPDAVVLGGEVERVESALDAWNVARSRDVKTGDIVHPPLVYMVDRDGVIRYASTGGVDAIVELTRRMAG